MRLYDGSGHFVEAFDAGFGGTSFSEIMFTPSIAGDYFVEVSSNDGSTGSYAVSALIDDFQAGLPTGGSAAPRFGAVTVNGGPASGTIEFDGDHDWFAVDLVAGTHYQIFGSAGYHPNLRLFDLNGRNIGEQDLVNFAATYTGTYYVDASYNGGRNPYVFSVTTANANNDFNHNGHSDMLWRSSAGELVDWSINGGAIASSTDLTFNGARVRPDASWSIAATTDFNADGSADLLWHGPNGELIEWTMDGARITSSAALTRNGVAQRLDSSWSVAAVGNFTGGIGEADRDVLWRNSSTNQLIEWNVTGSAVTDTFDFGAVRPDASWSIAGVGDFNGDRASDILWRDSNGEVVTWTMRDTRIASGADVSVGGKPIRVDASWSVAGIGDFNDDGKADILWRNTSGEIAEWQMNGSAIASSGFVTSQGAVIRPDASWHIVEIGDFNGDARSDILWRNDSGAMAEWLMNGSQITSSFAPSSGGAAVAPDASWQTQAKPTQFI